MNVGQLSEVRELPDEVDDVIAIANRVFEQSKPPDLRAFEVIFQAAVQVYRDKKALSKTAPSSFEQAFDERLTQTLE